MASFRQVLGKQRTEQLAGKGNINGQEIVALMLTSDDLKETIVLTEDVLKRTLQSQGHSVTGKSGDLAYEIEATGIKVYAVYYLFVLEQGATYADKMPPVDDILAWVKRKGIGGADPESAAFAIAKSIQRNGLKPHPGLLDEWREAFTEEVKDAMMKAYKDSVKKFITGNKSKTK